MNEYAVAAMKNVKGDYIHQWIVVTDDKVDSSEFAENLDEALQTANKNYKVARGKALKGISVKPITKQKYYQYLDETKKKGGQIKTPKVLSAEKMKGFLAIVNS